ncbi:hypothetical protein [Gymnodinialimonas ulvae]|uniref:hypothetical protein n=1 Tax=Gymnodinialimonas ulvae TaxID=3126504 RepID=UPI0030EF73E3
MARGPALAICAAGVVCATGASAQASPTCRATLAAHDTLAPGLSVAEVVDRIGCDGVTIRSVAWDGNGVPGSNMILIFGDDVLLSMQQIGLQ